MKKGLLGLDLASPVIAPVISPWVMARLFLGPLVMLALWFGALRRPGNCHPAHAPLPSYRLELFPDDLHRTSCAPETATRLTRDSFLSLVLRPHREVLGPVQVDSYLVRDGQFLPWPVQPAAARTGAFHLRAPISALPELDDDAAEQDIELAFALSRPGGPVQEVLHTRFTLVPLR